MAPALDIPAFRFSGSETLMEQAHAVAFLLGYLRDNWDVLHHAPTRTRRSPASRTWRSLPGPGGDSDEEGPP